MDMHAVQVSPSSRGHWKFLGMGEGVDWSSISFNTLVRFGQFTLHVIKPQTHGPTGWKRMGCMHIAYPDMFEPFVE